MPDLRSRLHLEADTSIRALHHALVARGHDVTRTPNEWMVPDADDETQLLGATARGRCIFTFNIRDFVALAQQYPVSLPDIFSESSVSGSRIARISKFHE